MFWQCNLQWSREPHFLCNLYLVMGVLSTCQNKGHMLVINYVYEWQKLGAGERERMENPQMISATPTIMNTLSSNNSHHSSLNSSACPWCAPPWRIQQRAFIRERRLCPPNSLHGHEPTYLVLDATGFPWLLRNEMEVVYDVILIFYVTNYHRHAWLMYTWVPQNYTLQSQPNCYKKKKKAHVDICTKIAIQTCSPNSSVHYSHYTMQLLHRKAQGGVKIQENWGSLVRHGLSKNTATPVVSWLSSLGKQNWSCRRDLCLFLLILCVPWMELRPHAL